MMRHLLLVIVIAVAALSASWVLVPGGEEQALMQLKDRHFGQARQRYEIELANSGLNKNIVLPLLELRIAAGDIEQAIELNERYLQSFPTDVTLLQTLLEYYLQDQRMDAYLQTLQRLCELAPTPERLWELAFRYRLAQRPERERETLQQLVVAGGASASDVLRLADLQAAQGDWADAVQTLDELWMARPEAFGRAALNRAVLLYLQMQQPVSALGRAQAWLERSPDPDVAIGVAQMFINADAPAPGLALLRALPAAQQQQAEVYGLIAQLRIEIGEGAALLAELLDREQATALSEPQRVALVVTALQQGRHKIATERAKSVPFSALPQWTLVPLIESALEVGQRDRALDLLDTIPAGLMAANPVLSARLTATLGRTADALNWARTAEQQAIGTQRVELAQVYLQLSRREDSLRVLADVDPASLDAPHAGTLARLYVALDAAARGLASLQGAGITDGEVWALLATAAGAEPQVLDWLNGQRKAPPSDTALAEIQELAVTLGLNRLADAAAERGQRDFDGAPWRIRLAERRIVQQRPERARSLLVGLTRSDLASDEWYKRMLFAAHRAGMDVFDSLSGLARETLAMEGKQSQAVRTLAYDLLGIDAAVAALPLLEPLTAQDPTEWFDVFVAALILDGQHPGAIDRLLERLDDLIQREPTTGLPVLTDVQSDSPPVQMPLPTGADSKGGESIEIVAQARLAGAAITDPAVVSVERGNEQRDSSIWAALETLESLGARWPAVEARRRLALDEPVDRLDWFYAYIDAAGKLLSDTPLATDADLQTASAIPSAQMMSGMQNAASLNLDTHHQRRPATVTATTITAANEPLPPLAEYHARDATRFVQQQTIEQTLRTLLDRPDRSPAGSEALVLAFFEHVGAEQALPQLRRLAARGAVIQQIYRDTLASLGLRQELVQYLTQLAGTSNPKRAAVLADELLSLGEKAAALRIYQRAAADAAPDSEAVEQLLYLWGPRPDAAAIQWLIERMRSSDRQDQKAWAEHILALGGAAPLALAMREKVIQHGDGEALALIYLRAVAGSASKPELAAQIETLIQRTNELDNLRGIAKLAEERDLPDLAVMAYTRLLAQAPDDVQALRFRGLNAYDTGRYQEAEIFLKRYHGLASGDFESHYFYAEALTAQGFTARAAPEFSKVIAMLERAPKLNQRMRSVLAKSQHRLRRVIAARGSYERLLAERPGARDLRADYADLLHEERSLIRARSLLARP